MDQSKEMARIAYNALSDKKGEDIKIIDITGISVLADYFIIANGNSDSQVNALVDNVEEALHKAGYPLKQREGQASGSGGGERPGVPQAEEAQRGGAERAVEVANGIGGTCLRCDFQDTCVQIFELLWSQIILCLIESKMAIDSDSTKADVYASKFVYQLPHPLNHLFHPFAKGANFPDIGGDWRVYR